MERIKITQEFLSKVFDSSEYFSSHPEIHMYRYEHSQRVAHWGRKIAEKEHLNVDALVVGCLLHDISYSEEMLTKEDHKSHGRKSAEISRKFVESLKFEPEVELSILYGIATHEDGIAGFEGSATVLSKSISDADYLDRYDVYRIYETLEFFEFSKMETEEKIKFCERKIIDHEKLFKKELATNYAKKCFHEELLLQKMSFERMLAQFENSKEFF